MSKALMQPEIKGGQGRSKGVEGGRGWVRVLRQLFGAPDYGAYLEHCWAAGHAPRLSEREYVSEFLSKGWSALLLSLRATGARRSTCCVQARGRSAPGTVPLSAACSGSFAGRKQRLGIADRRFIIRVDVAHPLGNLERPRKLSRAERSSHQRLARPAEHAP